LKEEGEFSGSTLDLDYRLRLWAPTSTFRAVSAVAELLVKNVIANCVLNG